MLAMSVTYETCIRRKVPPLKFQMIPFYILTIALSELGADLCYPATIRTKWNTYQITENIYLNEKVKKIYEKLRITSNAECFYEQFYAQLLTYPLYFSGLDFHLSVVLLRKSADKILAHFVRNSSPSQQHMESNITSHEIDALEYLGRYVLHNIEKKLVRKKISGHSRK